MGWNIWPVYNDTHINADQRERFNALAFDNHHVLHEEGDGPLEFDSDAMEHADYLMEDWAVDFLLASGINGTVIFTGDGEDTGNHWGYQFSTNGELTHLAKRECYLFLANNEEGG